MFREPYIGQDVLYTQQWASGNGHSLEVLPAKVVSKVSDQTYNLVVFTPRNLMFVISHYSEDSIAGTWRYREETITVTSVFDVQPVSA